MKRPILVVGVQRSGTSLVAGILFRLGVFMGDWFLKKNKFNPTGFFEDIEFLELEEERWKGKITKEEWTVRVFEVIKRRQEEVYGFTHWGWKNPASSLFIHEYIEICNPIIIKCVRNKKDNLESMQKMFWNKGAELQYKHKTEQLDKLTDCIEIDYDSLKENTEYEIRRLIGYLKLNPSKKRIFKAIESVIQKPILNKLESEHYTNYL